MVHSANRWLLATMFAMSWPILAAEPADQPWDCDKGLTWPSSARTRLKPSEAIAIASKAAKGQGTDLSRYRLSSICFSALKDKGSWTVFFDGLKAQPGNHFLVWVRDDTGATIIMPGE